MSVGEEVYGPNPRVYSSADYDALAAECERLRALHTAMLAAAPKAEPQPSDDAKDAATVKDSLTAGKAQMERDSAELRRLCAERDQLKAELAAFKSATVVMPDRQNCDGLYGKNHAYADGWNDCLDEAAQLNRSKT